jgi:hypothetical protein
MAMNTRIPTGFKTVYHFPGTFERMGFMELDLPPAKGQREPGTQNVSILLANGLTLVKAKY